MRVPALVLASVLIAGAACSGSSGDHATGPVPVIFETDLGEDIDDVWALVMLLNSPQLDVRLITTTWGLPQLRARSVARLLELAGRTDIPIALGAARDGANHLMRSWPEAYDLDGYPGTVHADAVQAVAGVVRASSGPVTYITVGPPATLASVVEAHAALAEKVDYVAMMGSIRRGYGGGGPSPEWNARASVEATRTVLNAGWRSTTLAPIDTAGEVVLDGGRYARVRDSGDPLIEALMENYRLWRRSRGKPERVDRSSTLFDTVAVYLARPGPARFLELEDVRLQVTDEGFTRRAAQGAPAAVALSWTGLEAYKAELVESLLAEPPGKP